jgi:hypothetical protein
VLRLRHASPAVLAPELTALASVLPGGAPGGGGLLAALEARRRRDPQRGVDTIPLIEPPGRDRAVARRVGHVEIDRARFVPSLRLLGRTRDKRDFEVVAPVVAAMGLDRSRARAARLLVDDPAAARAALGTRPVRPLRAGEALEVLSHEERDGAARIVVRAPAGGFLRLAYTHDPSLRVRLDGSEVPFVADALGGVVVALPEGRHELELAAHAPPLRLACLIVSALAAAAALVFAVRRSEASV